MKNQYYIITPNNSVRGPFASAEDAQQEIPDSHDTPMHDHVTDMKACSANLRRETGKQNAEIEHCQTWVPDTNTDPDENGYLIFSLEG